MKLAPEVGEPFPEVPRGLTPSWHQRVAHQRLHSSAPHGGRSTVVGTPAVLGKVSAGLHVGERERLPHTAMGPEHLATDWEALRAHPPHIRHYPVLYDTVPGGTTY